METHGSFIFTGYFTHILGVKTCIFHGFVVKTVIIPKQPSATETQHQTHPNSPGLKWGGELTEAGINDAEAGRLTAGFERESFGPFNFRGFIHVGF